MLTLYFKQKVCHVSSSKGKWKCHPWIPLGRIQDTNVDSLLSSSSYLFKMQPVVKEVAQKL